jgi:O-antigen/teichoic acid export membrane protein
METPESPTQDIGEPVEPAPEGGTPGLAWRTVKNSVWGMIEFLWPLALALFASPFMVHRLGVDAFGVLSVVGVTLGFFGFLDLGIGGAATRHIAVAHEKGDTAEVNRVVGTVLAFYLIVGAVGALIVVGSAGLLATKVLRVPVWLQPITQFAFYVSAVGFAMQLISGLFIAIPRAIQRYDISARLSIAFGTLSTLTTVVILLFGKGLGWVVVGALAVNIANLFVAWIFCRRLIPNLRTRVHFESELFKELASFGAYFLMAQLGVLLLYQADKIMVGAFVSVAAVTYYVVPGNLATKIQGLIAAATGVVFPLSSALFETGKRDAFERLYREGTRLVLIIGTAISVPMAVYAGKFLTYWMGPEIAQHSAVVMMVLVGTYYLLGLTAIPWQIAMGLGRVKVNAIFTFLMAATDIALFLVLIRPFGVVGAALAYLISALVGVPALIVYIERRVIGFSGAEFLKIGWRIWVVAAVQALLAWLSLSLVTNLLLTLILMVVSLVSFGLIYVLFGFMQPGDKDLVRMLWTRVRGRFPGSPSEV